jgi:hypothetical protein
MDEHDLDGLFAEARGQTAPVPPGLLARVLEDAYAGQAVAAPLPRRRRMPGWLAGLIPAGGVALSGLAVSALAGLWIGLAVPMPFDAPLGQVSEALWPAPPLDNVELIPSLDGWTAEG